MKKLLLNHIRVITQLYGYLVFKNNHMEIILSYIFCRKKINEGNQIAVKTALTAIPKAA